MFPEYFSESPTLTLDYADQFSDPDNLLVTNHPDLLHSSTGHFLATSIVDDFHALASTNRNA